MQRVRKAVDPPKGARADWQILLDLAATSGADWHHESPADIFDEFALHAPNFAGISHARLDAQGEDEDGYTGLQWPCPDPDHPGTRYLHEGGVLRGKGLMTAVDYRPSDELPDDDYGLLLSTGRTLYHYNAATQTRRDPGLDTKQPGSFVQLHPRDARKRDIRDGDPVTVTTRRGAIDAIAHVSRQVKPGCIWMALHFAEARANVLTNDKGDAVTGTAEYKVCAAEITKASDYTGELHQFRGSHYQAGLAEDATS
jgi:predicted molibdopterin-dependent oxidoreductase YjgC